MSEIFARHSPPSSPDSRSTPTIETKEGHFPVTIHIPPSAKGEGMPRPRMTAGKATPEPPKAPEQATTRQPQEDDAHGCCLRGCWSCVGCACFGGFLGALFWARAATGH